MSQSTTIALLIFVVLAGVYLWNASDPTARSSVAWSVLIRDASIGAILGWFLKPYYDARRGLETTRDQRIMAAIGSGSALAFFDVAIGFLAAIGR